MKFNDYSKIVKEVSPIAKEYLNDSRVNEFVEYVNSKSNDVKPSIIVYGVYNAGKSSLINALFGQKEKAKTGDAPETSKITKYDYNGYSLYDTPGINAPIKHEEMTEYHLKKTDIVLFVMHNDGSFEERYIYEKIGDILKAKKPLMIILNNKTGVDIESEEASNEINSINKHLITICDEKGIVKAEEKIDIIFVNPIDALDGKLENEEELIEESNILAVEEKIKEILKKTGKDKIILTLNSYIEDFLKEIENVIISKMDNPTLKKIKSVISEMNIDKRNLELILNNKLENILNYISSSLPDMLLSSSNPSTIESFIKDEIKKFESDLMTILQKEHNNIKENLQNLDVELKELSLRKVSDNVVGKDDFSFEKLELEKRDSKKDEDIDISSIILPDIINKLPIPIPRIPIEIIKVVVSLISSLFSNSDDRDNAERELEIRRANLLSAKNKADQITFKLNREFEPLIKEAIDSIYDNNIKILTKLSKKIGTNNEKLSKEQEKIKEIYKLLR